jgi:hypothetical protein
MNVLTSLLGLVIVSHLSPKGSGRFKNSLSCVVSSSCDLCACVCSDFMSCVRCFSHPYFRASL